MVDTIVQVAATRADLQMPKTKAEDVVYVSEARDPPPILTSSQLPYVRAEHGRVPRRGSRVRQAELRDDLPLMGEAGASSLRLPMRHNSPPIL